MGKKALTLPLRQPGTDAAQGLAYYRVSTTEQANTSYDDDGFSIQAQRDYCQRKATELGVQLVDEYIDRGKSARTADRPGLQAMLARVKEDLEIQYVFVHKLDRLARNRADDVQIGVQLAKHGVRLVSCTENIDDTPSGKLVHGIMADIAEWYSANLSEEAKKGMRKKAENGGTPGRAPIGYVNLRLKLTELGKDIGVVKPHDTYAPIITECFKLYDSGHCTLGDVAAYANAQGLRMPADRRVPERPISTQRMQQILRNRYYIGRVVFEGVEYQGDHLPLIDEDTFQRVQALLTARNMNKDKSKKRPHYLKGTLHCARCGRRLGITVPTKRQRGSVYPYFYCLGRQVDKNSCPQSYMPIGQVEDAVRDYLATVRLPSERIHALRESIIESFSGKQERGRTEIAKQRRRITELEQRRQKAKAAYYADVLSLAEFKAEQESINHGIKAAEDQIATWSIELDGITRALDDAFQLLANPQALFDAVPDGFKLLLVQALFEKLWIADTRVVGSELTAPFAELLTLEARLVWKDEQVKLAAPSGPTVAADTATYHRRRNALVFPDIDSAWTFLSVERPYGALVIDEKNPRPRGRGSNMTGLVPPAGFEPAISTLKG